MISKAEKTGILLFKKYRKKIRIHFAIASAIIIIILGFLAMIYPTVESTVEHNITTKDSYTVLLANCGVLTVGIVLFLILAMLWLQLYDAFHKKNVYAKYKMEHPTIHRVDQEILDAAKIKLTNKNKNKK